ncbi:MAG: HlyC/CorC family transporter [Proteobacteria bacterium]|nr:HlyC/CorC family transporter [Pseudomonadota bacterium]
MEEDVIPEKLPESEERLSGLITWVKSLLPAKNSDGDGDEDSLREAIEELIEEKETPQSSVALHERRLITNILQLRDLPVVDVMVPRADIVAIDISAPREELIQLLAEKPHSRIPVYKEDLDNIIGVVHIKDMVANIASGKSFELKDIMREPMVVSPAMRGMDLLLHLRQSKVHIAFVVDEFGGIDGLITINDLIEAIVGEIDDEYTFEIEPQLIERPDGSALADARYPIHEFEAKYGNVFQEDDEDGDVDTLGGLITSIAGHVPGRGEVIRHSSGIEFEIIDADPRRIMRVRIRHLPKKVPAAAQE